MPPRNKPRALIIGRRIGAGAFWLMAVFVIFASTRSVLGQLYGAAAAAPSASADEARCAQELRSLSRLLADRAADELRLPRDRSRTVRWLADWDRRYASLKHPCASLDDARRTLRTLRDRIEAMLHERERDQLPLTERIERALNRLKPGEGASSRTPKET
ncbi:MAG TPA: hypothetical protein VF331_05975 [Polyangiales bacterium]